MNDVPELPLLALRQLPAAGHNAYFSEERAIYNQQTKMTKKSNKEQRILKESLDVGGRPWAEFRGARVWILCPAFTGSWHAAQPFPDLTAVSG